MVALASACRKDEAVHNWRSLCREVHECQPAQEILASVSAFTPVTYVAFELDCQVPAELDFDFRFQTWKEDLNPGPGVAYKYTIYLFRDLADSIGFINSSDFDCYPWLNAGDTIWATDPLGSSALLYETDPWDECDRITEPRYVGFVRIIAGDKYCGYIRLLPMQQDTSSSYYGFKLDRMRIADCAWQGLVIE